MANLIDGSIPGTVVDGKLNGTGEDDVILGPEGNVVIYGNDGNDRIFTGAGLIESGKTVHGGNGNDYVVTEDGLWSANLFGDAGNDTLIALTAAYPNLDGGSGADYMMASGQYATFRVDNVGDRVVMVNCVETHVASSISFDARAIVSGETQYLFLSLSGSDNLQIKGTDHDDRIYGNIGNNLLEGLAGSDSLYGGDGGDTLDGGIGADMMDGGIGSDTFHVDNAGDKVIEKNVAGIDKVHSSVSYSISGQFIENLTLTGSAHISGTGNSLSNAVAGNAGNNKLYGLQGDDVLNGLSGQDVLYGGIGNDRLIGGAGPDRFVFDTVPNTTTNQDTIADFNVKDDNIWLDDAVFSAAGKPGLLTESAFHVGAAAADSSDRIIYNWDTGALLYDSNGSAAGGVIQFATVARGLAMTNADFLII